MKALKCAMIVASAGLAFVAAPAWAASFTAGDIVVYRVGDGSNSLVNTGNAVFLDEYAPNGTLLQSVPMPTSADGANYPLIASGTAQSEGLLTRSTDGQYLMLAGYGTTTGGGVSLKNTSAPRVVGRVDFAGNVDTTTALTDFATLDTPRSVASNNGIDLWVTGNTGGVRYATLGSTTSTSLTSSVTAGYQVNIFGGQLYATTHASPNFLVSIGNGLPETDGQAILPVPPTGNSLTSPDAFFFADLDGAPGLDTVYVADDARGILKYCLSDIGAWVYEGREGTKNDLCRGLTGFVQADNSVVLYSTRLGGNNADGSGGEIISVTDSSGFNATMNGTIVSVALAPAGTAFRGVALAPVPEPSTLGLLAAGLVGLLGCRFLGRRT